MTWKPNSASGHRPINNRAFNGVGLPETGAFRRPRARPRAQACGRLIERGQIASPVTLKGMFDQDEGLREIGGAQYLVKLAAAVVTVINAEDYGREIRDCSRRELIESVRSSTTPSRDLDQPAPQQIESRNAVVQPRRGWRIGRRFRRFQSALGGSLEMIQAAYDGTVASRGSQPG